MNRKIFFTTFILVTLNSLLFSQVYEIKFDTLNASGWFGGDNRPGQNRNVAVAQSVTIDQPINLQSFAFYFTSQFDSAANPTGSGHEVTLKLHIRDSSGTVIQSNLAVVPDSFQNGWVTWENINLNILVPGKYIFSTYLVGGFDSVKVNSGQGCDLNAGYPGGERFTKYVVNDSDAVSWGDWSQHPWDSDFWLSGSIITDVDEHNSSTVTDFTLHQNYPNPFNPGTKISWKSPVTGHQSLIVYDALGNEITTLVDEYKPAGSYETEFDATDLPSGIYFYRLQVGKFVQTRKMILMK